MYMTEKQKIHFIGIGGAGMSGIAKILLELGYQVTGSDLNSSETINRLKKMGAVTYPGHHENNLESDVDIVVVSSAIPNTNEEVVKAKKLGIPIIQRAEMLARIMKRQKGIAIAGAHGKTTTTSMISLMLENNNYDPTVIVGGELNDIGGNAKLGQGEYLVAEADESDGSFLKLNPLISVITNIENDHLDYYGTEENIVRAFQQFIKSTDSQGYTVLCLDDAILANMIPALENELKVITYGFSQEAHFSARDLKLGSLPNEATVYRGNQELGKLTLNVPGKHNILNALAAVAVGINCGLTFKEVALGLQRFRGVQRRFQEIGTINGIKIVDDYAHHPTELKATLAAARSLKPGRIIAVFQPHRFSRTQLLAKEFGKAFQDADVLILNKLYSAGEKPIPGVDSGLIIKEIQAQTQQQPEYIADMGEMVTRLREIAQPGDFIITLGAGDIWEIGAELLETLRNKVNQVDGES